MRPLADLTWVEAEALKARQPVVLLPMGAIEAHGPHLPLATDVILSEELARRAGAALEAEGRTVVMAPTLGYAVTEYASDFAGTISVSFATASSMLLEICKSLIRQGFERVCLINSHLEPAHVAVLTEVSAKVKELTGHTVAFPDQLARRWARTLTDEFKRGACHAGSYETSLLLASRPELVRDEIRLKLEPRPIDLAKAMKTGVVRFAQVGATQAYFGDPATASVDEGEAIYANLVTMVVTTVRETWP